MKGDDDTFVKIGAVIEEAKKVSENRSLYIGNINFYHKPLHNGTTWTFSISFPLFEFLFLSFYYKNMFVSY